MLALIRSLKMTRVALPFTVTFLALWGCVPHKSHASTPDAIVTEAQYRTAFSIVSSIDYLPFEFAMDGCYARALYMSMELASNKIPSSATFAIVEDAKHPLRTKNGVTWRYHVAPMIKVHENDEPTIIDPSMGEGTGLSLSRWIQDMSYAGARPIIVSVQGSHYSPRADMARMDQVVHNFGEMDPFRDTAIQHACNVMYRYIGQAGYNVETRREHLLERTNQLLTSLNDSGKLIGQPQVQCGE